MGVALLMMVVIDFFFLFKQYSNSAIPFSFPSPSPAQYIFCYFDKTVKLEVILAGSKNRRQSKFASHRVSVESGKKSEMLECNTKTMLRERTPGSLPVTHSVYLRETPFHLSHTDVAEQFSSENQFLITQFVV